MMGRSKHSPLSTIGGLLSVSLMGLLALPLLALFFSISPSEIMAGVENPNFLPALLVSLQTSGISLTATIVMGTPLAWWLSRSTSTKSKWVSVLVELPIMVPPAVIGVALLTAFGQNGVLGEMLGTLGLSFPFTQQAVIIAQIAVSSPFYIQAAVNAFSKVNSDTLIVARTLGASPSMAFLKVALPMAFPGLIVGASLAWARALGEFGATLLFAGNMPGKTQTMPLAIFSAMESNVSLAVVYSIVLAGTGVVLLFSLRYLGPRKTKQQEAIH